MSDSTTVLYGPQAPLSPMSRQGVARTPRGIIKINNEKAAYLAASVTNRSHFSADIWKIELEPWRQPQGFGLAYWSDIDSALVEVLFGFLPPDAQPDDTPESLTSLILGQVDDIDLNPTTGKLTLSGRDLSARLIDARTTNRWPNQTASQIITEIANQYDLIPDVTPTKLAVKNYYFNSTSTKATETPVWDVVVFLAQSEGFDAYVTGRTLYFGPEKVDKDPWQLLLVRDVNGLVWSNATRMALRRSLTIAGDMQVTVLSHSPVTGKAVEVTARRAGKHGPRNTASGYAAKQQQYVIHKPNMDQAQAQAIADNFIKDLTKFERVVEFDAEGDLGLSTRKLVQLSGTQTTFDQKYHIDTLHWNMNMDGGFTMNVHMKNHETTSSTFL